VAALVAPPRALLVAVVVALCEALVLLGFAVAVVVEAVRGDRSTVTNVVLLVALLVLWATALAFAARGLRGGHRWARSPVLLSQILLLVVGIPLAQGGSAWWAGLVLIALSVVGLVAVLGPGVTAALDGDRRG
jgi:hypothetical protein